MSGGPILELRMRRSWVAVVAVAVPAFALLMVAGSAEVLSKHPNPGPGDLLPVLFIIATLGGLIVIPGTAELVRLARGIPDVRIDAWGVVWGRDRSRDLAIAWTDVEGATAKAFATQFLTDRVFVLQPRPGRARPAAGTLFGRAVAIGNRIQNGSPFVISTISADHSWAVIRTVLAAHLGDRPIELASVR
jgi:hypothetical protein